jgi:hypothetical protein
VSSPVGIEQQCAAFVTVMHANRSHVRSTFARNPGFAFRQQLDRIVNLWDNLRLVNTSLPLHVLHSGTVRRLPAQLELLQREGVALHAMPNPWVPAWSSGSHYSSFAKLHVFNASWSLRCKLIYLDTDLLILRNIDHLASVPTPAVVFRGDVELLNTGVQVVHVRSQEQLDFFWRTAAARFNHRGEYHPRCMVRHGLGWQAPWGVDADSHGSDQEILADYALRNREGLFELPATYNAYPWQMNHSTAWCMDVHVLHKVTRLEQKGLTPECVRFIRARQRHVLRARRP